MKKVLTTNIKILVILISFFMMGCKKQPVPNAQTGIQVTSTSPEFTSLAKKINPNLDCSRIDCCFLDGIETSCSLVQACLDAGFCVIVKTTD